MYTGISYVLSYILILVLLYFIYIYYKEKKINKRKETTMKTYSTNYLVAVNWLGNSRVLCNNIPNIDPTIWDNMRFSLELEDGYTRDIFMWYITDLAEREVEYLEKNFGLLFTYSELLDAWILCVDHYGTNWEYVECETTIKEAARALGESI